MAWTKTGRWTQLAIAMAVLVGCTESREPITGVEHCEQFLQIHCLARHCCTVPSLTSDVSPEACAESIDFVRMLCATSNYDEDPGIAWDGLRAEAELEAQRRAAESCTLPDPHPFGSLSGLVEGLVEPGGSCLGPHPGFVCREGSYCHATMNVCLRYLEEGEACPRGTICAEGLFCPTTDRVCSRPGEVGDPCEGSAEAFDRECVAGLFCDLDSLRCQPRIAIGEPCARPGEGGHDTCVAGAFCATATTQTCTAQVAEGGACVGEYVSDCAPGLRCVEGTCLRLSPADVYYCN